MRAEVAINSLREVKEFWESEDGRRFKRWLDVYDKKEPDYDSEAYRKTYDLIYGHVLRYAEPFFCDKRIQNMIVSAAETMPLNWHIYEESLPAPNGFLWFEENIEIPNFAGSEELEDVGWPLRAIGWGIMDNLYSAGGRGKSDKLIGITYFHDISEKPNTPVRYFPVESQGVYPGGTIQGLIDADVPGLRGPYKEENIYKTKIFLCLLAFLEQQIITHFHEKPDRATRRRAEREGLEIQKLNVITLRRVTRKYDKGGYRDVEWQCQWWVHGHWRDQWYPSREIHQPKWIAGYIKGPEGKPFRKAERLFDIER